MWCVGWVFVCGIATRGHFFDLLLELKKTLEFFCDFVFVFGLKLHEELNFKHGLVPC